MALRRSKTRKPSGTINEINMTSLIDLIFLLLVTFMIAMPAIEQGISVRLPQGKTDTLPTKKANVVSMDVEGKTYLNNKVISLEELERTLGVMAAEDPDVAVQVRGDERIEYGKMMQIMKILYKVRITRMALLTAPD